LLFRALHKGFPESQAPVHPRGTMPRVVPRIESRMTDHLDRIERLQNIEQLLEALPGHTANERVDASRAQVPKGSVEGNPAFFPL